MKLRRFNEADGEDISKSDERLRLRRLSRQEAQQAKIDLINVRNNAQNALLSRDIKFDTPLELTDELRIRLKEFGKSMQFLIDQNLIKSTVITKSISLGLNCRIIFKLDKIDSNELFNQYNSLISEIEYILSTQPNICIEVVTFNIFQFKFN